MCFLSDAEIITAIHPGKAPDKNQAFMNAGAHDDVWVSDGPNHSQDENIRCAPPYAHTITIKRRNNVLFILYVLRAIATSTNALSTPPSNMPFPL